MKLKNNEKEIHKIFEISILLKGFLASLEVISGISVLFVTQNFITRMLFYVIQEGVRTNPDSFWFNHLVNFLQNFSSSTKYFAGLYLLTHGLIKLGLVYGLYKEKYLAYPLSILFFTFFAIFELNRFLHTHSLMLVVLMILDLWVIVLTWHEYSLRFLWKKT